MSIGVCDSPPRRSPTKASKSLSSDTRVGAAGTAALDDCIGADSCEEIAVLVDGMEDVGTGIRLVRVVSLAAYQHVVTALSLMVLEVGHPTAPCDT